MSGLLIFQAPQRETPPASPDTPEKALKGQRSSATFTQAKQSPFSQFFNRLALPDPTLIRFGGGEGFDLYFRIRRQITALSGIVGQLVDGAMKRRPTVVAGDLSDAESVEVADNMRRIWDDIPEKPVTLRKSLDNMITCGFAAVENIWSRDEQTGIVAPTRLADRPSRNFIFTLDEVPRFVTIMDPIHGEPIDPLKFIFMRAGTTNTPYGESVFSDLYSAAWLYQQVQNFGVDALEKYGRPTPHVNVPRFYQAGEIADLDNFYEKKFGTFTRGFWEGTEVKVEYPSMALASSGAAGRAELEFMRFLEGQMYVLILRTQQTQDKTSGSRALESTRMQITDLSTITYSDILCDALQAGWMKPVMDINFPSLDAKLRPRFVPDPTGAEDKNALHERVMKGIDRGVQYSKQGYFRTFGVQEAKDPADVLGHPVERISDTAQGTPAPVANPNADDQQPTNDPQGDPATVQLTTTDGEILRIPAVMIDVTRGAK